MWTSRRKANYTRQSHCRHFVHIDLHFDEHSIVAYVVELVEYRQLAELLRAEGGVALCCGTAEKRAILLDGVRLDCVGDALARGWVLQEQCIELQVLIAANNCNISSV